MYATSEVFDAQLKQGGDRIHFQRHSVTGSIMNGVIRAGKLLNKMKANSRDWRMESLISLAGANSVVFRQLGGSHVIFRYPSGAMLGVPAHRPIKPVYEKNAFA